MSATLHDSSDDPYVDPAVMREANLRHDAELRALGIDLSGRHLGHVRSGWNCAQMIRKGKLTDKAIAKYQKRGFYDQDYKDARRSLMLKKSRRQGNFIHAEGRLIYSPL